MLCCCSGKIVNNTFDTSCEWKTHACICLKCVCSRSDYIFGSRELPSRVHQGILSGQPLWNLLCQVNNNKITKDVFPLISSCDRFMNWDLISCCIGLCLWRRQRARAPANTPPVQAVCCWNLRPVLRPATTLMLPVCTALGSVCTTTWQPLTVTCATTTCR